MALIFSIAECGISSTVMASSKKQTSSCTANYVQFLRCAQRINQLLENPDSANRDDACRDCQAVLEDFADSCLDSAEAQVVYYGLEKICMRTSDTVSTSGTVTSGAVVIGMSLFSIILALLVAVTSTMD